ncbi:DUF6049 family protein [Marmoricola sp. RAF53]|uniref:DUF6049 family protein n=1 Tax=Marmoricola sp. RAF53 TaxID=3233059 RepID=UPI003F9769B6
MSLPRTTYAVLTAFVSAVLLPFLVLPSPARAADAPAAPLTVRLTRLSPATIPAGGPVVLAGTVRNDSDETWSAINVHPFVSRFPMTTREDLAKAAAGDSEVEVGTRFADDGQFAPIGDLAPGASATFRIRLKHADLLQKISGAPGVYWIGVHALGQNATGRDGLADGRARTFIPLVAADTAPTTVSLVVPVRERVRRDPVGKLLDTSDWSRTLAAEGRLRRVVDFLASAGGGRPTLLIDPAVLEAVESVAADNPALSLGTATEEPTATPSPSTSPTGDSSDSPSRAADRLDADDRANAASWLSALEGVAARQTVLGLAYADPDTVALARRRPAMLSRAERTATSTFDRLGITETPAVAPPDGWLDDDALPKIATGSVILVSDHGAPRTRTEWRTADDQDLVFTDAEAAAGGPAPTAALDALALRQRIVSDAALRAAAGETAPMVVSLPDDWDPGLGWQRSDFFAALDQPWLSLTPVTGGSSLTPVFDAALGYPAAVRRQEIGLPNVLAAASMIRTGGTLGEILRTENTVTHQLDGTALTGVSYHARPDPERAQSQVLAGDAAARGVLAQVSVTGTDFVTLSGGSGTVAVTLVNKLDEPITVGVKADTGTSGVTIDTPDPVDMAPGERRVLRLRAKASEIGVHQVTLTPATASGASFGTPLTFSLRTTQVGILIWVVLGAGALLLVVMIARRILRGVREHRWRGQ